MHAGDSLDCSEPLLLQDSSHGFHVIEIFPGGTVVEPQLQVHYQLLAYHLHQCIAMKLRSEKERFSPNVHLFSHESRSQPSWLP